MNHLLYKVYCPNLGTCTYAGFRFNNGVSLWLRRKEALKFKCRGIFHECTGDCAPWYAVMDTGLNEVTNAVAGENACMMRMGRWDPPANPTVTLSDEAKAAGNVKPQRTSKTPPGKKSEPPPTEFEIKDKMVVPVVKKKGGRPKGSKNKKRG